MKFVKLFDATTNAPAYHPVDRIYQVAEYPGDVNKTEVDVELISGKYQKTYVEGTPEDFIASLQE